MCRIKQRTARPCIRGEWRGSLPRLNYDPFGPQSPYGPATIDLPIYFIRNAATMKALSSRVAIVSEEPKMLLPPETPRSNQCYITRIPTEILLQIVGYLVPTNCSFHVFPTTTTKYGDSRCTYLHKFCREPSISEDRVITDIVRPMRHHLAALAQTCRVLYEAYCTIMYGNNDFIFELASHGSYPVITGDYPPRVESWTKVLRGRHRIMWPLSKRTVQYVQHMTILGYLYGEHDELARRELRQRLLVTVRLLKLAQHLKDLTIDLRSLSKPDIPKDSMYQAPPPLPREVDLNARLGWSVRGPEDTVLRLRKAITSDEHPSLGEFWELFEDLRGIRDVVLSGHISVEMVEDLRAKMTNERTLPGATKSTSKRQASGSKRKRVDESQGRIKSRRVARR